MGKFNKEDLSISKALCEEVYNQAPDYFDKTCLTKYQVPDEIVSCALIGLEAKELYRCANAKELLPKLEEAALLIRKLEYEKQSLVRNNASLKKTLDNERNHLKESGLEEKLEIEIGRCEKIEYQLEITHEELRDLGKYIEDLRKSPIKRLKMKNYTEDWIRDIYLAAGLPNLISE